jgi:mannose/fructose/N-acetylgalactosamine-specific phosphotransferase system component IID
MVVHGLPMLNSISESGTIPNAVSPILPFALGSLALFVLNYSLKYAYANHKEALSQMRKRNDIICIYSFRRRLDKVFPILMAVGFTIVAMQMCSSENM